LVRALELKETIGGNVTIITVGNAGDEAIIRKALAIGADNAVRIDAEPTDAYFVAAQIAAYAKKNAFDLVLTGKETINYNGSQVGGMIAEHLELAYVSLASKLDVTGNVVTLEQEIVGGLQVVEVNTPLVVSCAKGMAEQRIPNMRGIMAARTKPLEVITPESVDLFTQYEGYQLPDAKKACTLIDPSNMDSLVELLHNEAKVI
jgi:electron transfer flavoprotein beta subunit